jgi:hypothetical protein
MDTEPQPQSIDPTIERLEMWAFIEIYGHKRLAGKVTQRNLGTEVMFQVDVPKGETEFSHSQLYSPKAIFSMTPTNEAWCRKWAAKAEEYDVAPLPFIPDDKPARQLVETNSDPESEFYRDNDDDD